MWPESQSVGIKLISNDGQEGWDRLIPLRNATFQWLQMGEEGFVPFQESNFHSALIMGFPDGTTMFLAESAAI